MWRTEEKVVVTHGRQLESFTTATEQSSGGDARTRPAEGAAAGAPEVGVGFRDGEVDGAGGVVVGGTWGRRNPPASHHGHHRVSDGLHVATTTGVPGEEIRDGAVGGAIAIGGGRWGRRRGQGSRSPARNDEMREFAAVEWRGFVVQG